jgi:hypothetical protein
VETGAFKDTTPSVQYGKKGGNCLVLNSEEDPIDEHYNKLNTDLQALDHETEEFKKLRNYVHNTVVKGNYSDTIFEHCC